MAPEDVAKQKYQEVLARIDAVEVDGINAALKELEVLRTVVERTFINTDWEVHRGRQLLDAVRQATSEYQAAFWSDLEPRQQQSWGLGLEAAQEFVPPEFQPSIAWAGIGRRQFEIYRQNSLFYITDLADDIRRSLGREVLLTTTGIRTPTQAMQTVKDFLGDGKKAANRAQAIVRTEVGRNFGMATQAGLDESAAFVPGLQKMWLHAPAGTEKTVRWPHVYMNGRSIPWNEAFVFPGGALRFPCDPNGPPGETVNCKCRLVPWHPDWQ